MISDATAKKQAISFFERQNLSEFAQMLRKEACLEEVFHKATKSLGKKKMLILYHQLPKQLKRYLLFYLDAPSQKLERAFEKIDDEFVNISISQQPSKEALRYLEKLEKVFLKYLENKL